MTDMLSFPQRVALSFDFPFYGHHLRQIIVATGGEFLFTLLDLPIRKSSVSQCAEGDFVLPWGNIKAYQAIMNLVNCKCLNFFDDFNCLKACPKF